MIDNIKFSISSIMLGIKIFLLSMMWMWAFIRLNRKELTKEGEKKFIYTKEEDTSKTWKLLTKRDSLIITCILHGTAPPSPKVNIIWLWESDSIIIAAHYCTVGQKYKKNPGKKKSWNQINQFHDFFWKYPKKFSVKLIFISQVFWPGLF